MFKEYCHRTPLEKGGIFKFLGIVCLLITWNAGGANKTDLLFLFRLVLTKSLMHPLKNVLPFVKTAQPDVQPAGVLT